MSEWHAVFHVDATLAELEVAIAEQVERSVDAVREQLADTPMVPGLREAVLEQARTVYERQVRETFTRGWLRLRAERDALAGNAAVVH